MLHVGTKLARFCALALLVLVAACGKNERSLNSLPTPYGVVTEIESSAYPAVVKVLAPGGSGLCTGTFISEKAVLTAAHCTLLSGEYTVVSSFGIFTTETRVQGGQGVINDPNDISLLIFDEAKASRAAGQVYDMGNFVGQGSEVRLVGFGCNNLAARSGAGTKRTGTNEVWYMNDYINLASPATTLNNVRGILGAENRAGSCFGDSGGPALIDGKVVGVAHAGGQVDDLIYSEYVDVGNRSDNRSFLATQNTLYDLEIAGL